MGVFTCVLKLKLEKKRQAHDPSIPTMQEYLSTQFEFHTHPVEDLWNISYRESVNSK